MLLVTVVCGVGWVVPRPPGHTLEVARPGSVLRPC